MTSRLDQSINVSTTALTIQNTNQSGKVDVSYKPKQVLPQMYQATPEIILTSSPLTGNLASKVLKYEITKEGCLNPSVCRVDLDITSASTDPVYPTDWTGIDTIDRIEARVGTTTVSVVYSGDMIDMINGMKESDKFALQKQIAPRSKTTHAIVAPITAATHSVYFNIPIVFFFNDKNQLMETFRLYLEKLEKITFIIYFKSSVVEMRFHPTAVTAEASVAITDSVFYANKLLFNEYSKNIIKKNIDGSSSSAQVDLAQGSESSSDESRNLLLGYSFDQFGDTCTSTTTNTVSFLLTKYILSSKFTVHPIKNAGTFELGKVLSMSLELNGVKLVDNLPRHLLNFSNEYVGESSLLSLNRLGSSTALGLTYDDTHSVSIDWNAIPQVKNLFSGGVSFSQIPVVKVTLVTGTIVAANYRVRVSHKSLQFLNISETGSAVVVSMT